MQAKPLLYLAALLALIGLAVNVAFDLDNVYDMTTTTLWVLVLVVVAAATMVGSKKSVAEPQAKP